MDSEFRAYRIKVQSSGRITLPAGFRKRHHIAAGDTVTLIDDAQGLHIKRQDRLLAESPLPL